MTETFLITGGAGFIGSAVVRRLIADTADLVVNLDALTYAGNPGSLGPARHHPRHRFVKADVADPSAVRAVLDEHRPTCVIHLAAESHVDRSIDGPAVFIRTNVYGTYNLLEQTLRYWRALPSERAGAFRFVHVSTDEVFGSLGVEGLFTEATPYDPSSPYSASKASADHLARAWHRTYGLPVMVTNCSNNYGPYQFPEKLIPLVIQKAMAGEALPVYGRGENVRDWLYVDDHASALLLVARRGQPGRTYNIGGGNERRNIEVVTRVCEILDRLRPDRAGPYARLITFVTDRPGHDARYAIDASRIRKELGWAPAETFETGLEKTIRWYLDTPEWVAEVTSGAYRGERLGVGTRA